MVNSTRTKVQVLKTCKSSMALFIFPVHLLLMKYVIMPGQNFNNVAVVKVLNIKTPQLFLPSQYIT